ncbi:MAG TPA: cytochrome c family protein [Casimicrobiaceae bacterium]|jgi:cytochrome c|nr:cytochrome c family protein [Casimicrobiaceae bacterium]
MDVDRRLPSKTLRLAGLAERLLVGSGAAFVLIANPGFAAAAGDPLQGARAFQNCVACHSIDAGRNMTGPSLADVVGRKAGGLANFHRYSDALKRSGIVWSEQTLDAWIANPAAVIPGNDMRFQGIGDAQTRNNLVAYLKAAAEGKGRSLAFQVGMNLGDGLPDLKQTDAQTQVKTIRYCDDTYVVTTGGGRTLKFWEFNLRFKTDSSSRGPRKGEPVLAGQGMQGDRAQIVFSSPAEIGATIKSECP